MSVSKMLMGQAANRYVDPVYVENLFSTHLYIGNGGSTATINNGIDLTGKGGLVWIKARNATENHVLFDTDRGVTKYISSNLNNAEATSTGTLTDFFNNGFKVDGGGTVGSSTDPYVSWTFRKQPKFFDVVTYAGNGTSGREITHNLKTTVGAIFVKSLNNTRKWSVFHRGMDASNPSHYKLHLDQTDARANEQHIWNDTEPTSSVFTVGNDGEVNASGENYVAYLFAHNDGDGGFGLTNDQDVIKCGSFTDSSSGWSVDLGFEPQFLLTKRADSTGNWEIVDTMRGFTADRSYTRLYPNLTNAKQTVTKVGVNSTGFFSTTAMEANGATIIYMAIRRGDMAVPTDATKVFAMDTGSNSTPSFDAGFPVDAALVGRVDSTDKWFFTPRLTGSNYLDTATTAAQASSPAFGGFNYQTQYYGGNLPSTYQAWMWKRAPGYFDVVCYTGDGGGNRDITHNLGSAPGMLWLKRRDGSSPYGDWYVQHTGIAATNYLKLNENSSQTTSPDAWNSTYASSNVFRVGSDNNVNTYEYIVYLFGTVAGVSKVGSYVGNGSNGRVIDCGFSGGARFILIKGATNTENWYIFDTVQGIVAGNDGRLQLDNTSAQFSNLDLIDPSDSGFIVNSGGEVNASGVTYIFYAIA